MAEPGKPESPSEGQEPRSHGLDNRVPDGPTEPAGRWEGYSLAILAAFFDHA
jgi:hypothetical protein